jgi:uncharacterized membrane protein YcaP (DUF421 family)
MSKEEIHLTDICRILFGDAPATFLIEAGIRTIIIYLLSLIFVKWLGKRMSGQISVTEMVVMLLIGAIISVPVQFPDRGIVQGIVLLLALLLTYNGINWLSFKRKKIECLIQGKSIMLVKDNVIQLNELQSVDMSKQQLYAVLRSKEIFNLGEVKRIYLEACGLFSVYEEECAKPGLPLFPSDDKSASDAKVKPVPDKLVCISCGYVVEKKYWIKICKHCHADQWITSVLTKENDE